LNIVHVYAQGAWHDEAYICGTREALQQLRTAVDDALKKGSGVTQQSTNDGEGYDIHIIVATGEQAMKLQLPYTNDIAADESTRFGPWNILRPNGEH